MSDNDSAYYAMYLQEQQENKELKAQIGYLEGKIRALEKINGVYKALVSTVDDSLEKILKEP